MRAMNRGLLVALVFLSFPAFAAAQEAPPEPTQNPDAAFRLFATANIYTFIKLDTRDGRLWQVQWGDAEHRFTVALNSTALATGGLKGRFTLYPTRNIHTFLLLDQLTGDTWHVQWGNPDGRFLARID